MKDGKMQKEKDLHTSIAGGISSLPKHFRLSILFGSSLASF
jgi:hypothetical protein